MDQEFRQLIDSLGHMTADRLRGYPVSEIRIAANEDLCTAHVTAVVPQALSDEQYTELMSRLIGTREFYLDELSIGFALSRGVTVCDTESAEASGSREFAYSGQ